MVYKLLLVPYNGSRPANHAVQHAYNIAKMGFMEKLTSEVNLLYVVRKIHVPTSLDYGMRPYSYSLQELTMTSLEYVREVYQDLKNKVH